MTFKERKELLAKRELSIYNFNDIYSWATIDDLSLSNINSISPDEVIILYNKYIPNWWAIIMQDIIYELSNLLIPCNIYQIYVEWHNIEITRYWWKLITEPITIKIKNKKYDWFMTNNNDSWILYFITQKLEKCLLK